MNWASPLEKVTVTTGDSTRAFSWGVGHLSPAGRLTVAGAMPWDLAAHAVREKGQRRLPLICLEASARTIWS